MGMMGVDPADVSVGRRNRKRSLGRVSHVPQTCGKCIARNFVNGTGISLCLLQLVVAGFACGLNRQLHAGDCVWFCCIRNMHRELGCSVREQNFNFFLFRKLD